MASRKKITFDVFTLDTKEEQLWKGTKKIHLRPKTYALLQHLIVRSGHLVTKEELLNAVWRECNVGEEALKHCMVEIRRALGDNAEKPRFIETAHRRGYRFIGKSTNSQRKDRGKSTKQGETGIQDPPPGTSPFVGRETELAQLQQHLEDTIKGSRRVVFISGEQGIGKTRLSDAFLDTVSSAKTTGRRSGKNPVPWIARGQCVQSHGTAEAYMPLLEALTGLCHTQGRQIINSLCRYAPLWMSQMPSRLSTDQILRIRISTRNATRERMLRELAEALEELTKDRPLILILEDLHWSDPSTLDWIFSWAQRRESSRLLLLATYRTAEVMTEDHPFKNIQRELRSKQLCSEIELTYLDEYEIGEYLKRRFPSHKFPARMTHWVQQRTGGNALFLVNLLDHLSEQGHILKGDNRWILNTPLEKIKQTIPPTIRQIVDRQIERCNPQEQLLLQAASVNGMEFSAGGAAAALNEDEDEIELLCRNLAARSQFLQPAPDRIISKGEKVACYRFIHVLYRNLCYQLIPSERRIRFHRRIAAFLEQEDGRQPQELYAQLAMHYDRGRDYRCAVRHYRKAVDNAGARYAEHESLELATRGIQLLEMLPASPERTELEIHLQNALGTALISTEGPGAEKARQAFSRARDLFSSLGPALRSGKKDTLFNSLYGLWNYHWGHANYSPALRLAEQLVQLSKVSKDSLVQDRAHFPLGITLMDHGEYAPALEHLEQSSGVKSRCCAEIARCHLGYVDSALGNIEKTLACALETRDTEYCIFAYLGAARLHMTRGEFREALERSQSAIDIALSRKIAEQWLTPMRVINGWATYKLGRKKKGQRQIHQALTIYKDIEISNLGPMLYAIYAEILLDGNRVEEGLAVIDGTLETSHRTGIHHYDAELYRLKGELLLQPFSIDNRPSDRKNPHAGKAEDCFKQAEAIAQKQRAKSLELRAVTSLSRLWQHQNRRVEAKMRLEKIYNWFTEGHNTADLKRARKLLEELNK
ncbi:MAG: AAA family ATPase [Acidobacteria bacterium]|nr:AAA family ATPase [Acidobacteriota bacterium]